MKKDCYNCKFKGSVPGSAHSRCNVIKTLYQSESDLLEIYISVGKYVITDKNTNEPIVKLNEYGVRSGWAMWPVDFDPIWVDSCGFYTEKDG